MADPLTIAAVVSASASVVGGVQAKQSADQAAKAAQSAGEFNAQIIERDIGLLEKQRGIINANFLVQGERSGQAFERVVQGKARAGYGYAGVDMSQGTPIQVLRENAREFDYEMAVAKYDNEIANMQINDAQEESRLSAQLSRMEGGAQAAGLRASGTASLIKGIGAGARAGIDTGLFE
jgi:hypothetical protein